jgi:hypothetical protein
MNPFADFAAFTISGQCRRAREGFSRCMLPACKVRSLRRAAASAQVHQFDSRISENFFELAGGP